MASIGLKEQITEDLDTFGIEHGEVDHVVAGDGYYLVYCKDGSQIDMRYSDYGKFERAYNYDSDGKHVSSCLYDQASCHLERKTGVVSEQNYYNTEGNLTGENFIYPTPQGDGVEIDVHVVYDWEDYEHAGQNHVVVKVNNKVVEEYYTNEPIDSISSSTFEKTVSTYEPVNYDEIKDHVNTRKPGNDKIDLDSSIGEDPLIKFDAGEAPKVVKDLEMFGIECGKVEDLKHDWNIVEGKQPYYIKFDDGSSVYMDYDSKGRLLSATKYSKDGIPIMTSNYNSDTGNLDIKYYDSNRNVARTEERALNSSKYNHSGSVLSGEFIKTKGLNNGLFDNENFSAVLDDNFLDAVAYNSSYVGVAFLEICNLNTLTDDAWDSFETIKISDFYGIKGLSGADSRYSNSLYFQGNSFETIVSKLKEQFAEIVDKVYIADHGNVDAFDDYDDIKVDIKITDKSYTRQVVSGCGSGVRYEQIEFNSYADFLEHNSKSRTNVEGFGDVVLYNTKTANVVAEYSKVTTFGKSSDQFVRFTNEEEDEYGRFDGEIKLPELKGIKLEHKFSDEISIDQLFEDLGLDNQKFKLDISGEYHYFVDNSKVEYMDETFVVIEETELKKGFINLSGEVSGELSLEGLHIEGKGSFSVVDLGLSYKNYTDQSLLDNAEIELRLVGVDVEATLDLKFPLGTMIDEFSKAYKESSESGEKDKVKAIKKAFKSIDFGDIFGIEKTTYNPETKKEETTSGSLVRASAKGSIYVYAFDVKAKVGLDVFNCDVELEAQLGFGAKLEFDSTKPPTPPAAGWIGDVDGSVTVKSSNFLLSEYQKASNWYGEPDKELMEYCHEKGLISEEHYNYVKNVVEYHEALKKLYKGEYVSDGENRSPLDNSPLLYVSGNNRTSRANLVKLMQLKVEKARADYLYSEGLAFEEDYNKFMEEYSYELSLLDDPNFNMFYDPEVKWEYGK